MKIDTVTHLGGGLEGLMGFKGFNPPPPPIGIERVQMTVSKGLV